MKPSLIKTFVTMLIVSLIVGIGSGLIWQLIAAFIIRNVGVTTYANIVIGLNFATAIINGVLVGLVLAVISRPHTYDGSFDTAIGLGIAGSLIARFVLPLYTYFVYIRNTVNYSIPFLSLREFYGNYLFGSILYHIIFAIVIFATVQAFYNLRDRDLKRKVKNEPESV